MIHLFSNNIAIGYKVYIFDDLAPSLSVLRIGSMEVGALLNDAYKEYEVGIKIIPV